MCLWTSSYKRKFKLQVTANIVLLEINRELEYKLAISESKLQKLVNYNNLLEQLHEIDKEKIKVLNENIKREENEQS
jgi:hypothetical protein